MASELNPSFPVWHIWRDGSGVSHQKQEWFDDFDLTSFIGNIPQVWTSPVHQGSSNSLFLYLLPGQEYQWHENPVPQWIVTISGRFFVETMDGVRVEMGPGEIAFGADQGCRCIDGRQGHRSGVVGPDPVVLMLIQVDADPFAPC
jgi:hypothetical protein